VERGWRNAAIKKRDKTHKKGELKKRGVHPQLCQREEVRVAAAGKKGATSPSRTQLSKQNQGEKRAERKSKISVGVAKHGKMGGTKSRVQRWEICGLRR